MMVTVLASGVSWIWGISFGYGLKLMTASTFAGDSPCESTKLLHFFAVLSRSFSFSRLSITRLPIMEPDRRYMGSLKLSGFLFLI